MTLLSIVKIMHLLGLVTGFGGAILTDLMILKNAILRPLDKQTVQTAHTLSRIVFAGLAILWVTGAVLVYMRVIEDPKVMMNQKIWAKVAIVAILTINGIAVHKFALSHLHARVGKQLFDLGRPGEVAKLTFVAGVSSVSWVVPFVLGVAKEFNFTVPALTILSIYSALILLAWAGFFNLAFLVTRREKSAVRPVADSSRSMPSIKSHLQQSDPVVLNDMDLHRKFLELRDRVAKLNNPPEKIAA
jgi:hypothetical protein